MWVEIWKLCGKVHAFSWYFKLCFQDEQPSVQEHVEVHAAAERSDHGEVSHAQSHMTKESANEMITGAENGVPVVTYQPKSE